MNQDMHGHAPRWDPHLALSRRAGAGILGTVAALVALDVAQLVRQTPAGDLNARLVRLETLVENNAHQVRDIIDSLERLRSRLEQK